MTAREKGARRERQARKIYEDAGYAVQPFYGRAFGETDGFGLFDLVAVADSSDIDGHPKPSYERGCPRFVQVKSNRAAGINEWSREVVNRFAGVSLFADFVVCHDNEGWRLLSPYADNLNLLKITLDDVYAKTFLDEREMDCEMGEGLTAYLRGESPSDAREEPQDS